MSSKAPIIIYSITGSQFVFKVLAALQSRNIPHYVVPVSLNDPDKRQTELPGKGIMVPQMKVGVAGEEGGPLVIKDSELILHWIEDNTEDAGMYPNEKAKELSERASDHTLAAMVWYYNHIDPKGYQNSIQAGAYTHLPSFLPKFISTVIINQFFNKPIAAKKKKSILKAIPDIDEGALEDEPKMRALLIEELKFFQEHLQSSPEQKYLLDFDRPTAADFSVYAQAVRLVAGGGTSDAELGPCCPELRNDSSLQRFWQWYDVMKKEICVEFMGKKPESAL